LIQCATLTEKYPAATGRSIFQPDGCVTTLSISHNSLGAISAHLFGYTSFRMPFALTRQEKQIVAVLALLIVLGLVGMAVL